MTLTSVTVTSNVGEKIHQGTDWEETPEGYLHIISDERNRVVTYSPGSWISVEANLEAPPAPTVTEIHVTMGGNIEELEKALATVKRYGHLSPLGMS